MSQPPEAAFFEQVFADTLSLTEDLRDSIISGAMNDATLDPMQKIRLSQAVSHLTRRSASAMSLLLMYKAILANQAQEIDNITVRLDDLYDSVTGDGSVEGLTGMPLPVPIQDLLRRADRVFAHMDQMYHMIAARLAS